MRGCKTYHLRYHGNERDSLNSENASPTKFVHQWHLATSCTKCTIQFYDASKTTWQKSVISNTIENQQLNTKSTTYMLCWSTYKKQNEKRWVQSHSCTLYTSLFAGWKYKRPTNHCHVYHWVDRCYWLTICYSTTILCMGWQRSLETHCAMDLDLICHWL